MDGLPDRVVAAEPGSTVVRRCSACGASVALPASVRSTRCAFCDSALVDAALDETEPVDKVVGFSVDKAQAASRLRAFLAAKWFAPESVRRASDPDELHDVLVPFYCFDAVARSSFSARIGVYWYRTETYTVRENGKSVTKTRRVRETEWFPLEGSHGRQWFDHLVSASRGLPEAEANQLEPFDLGAALPYAPALVAGLAAERATVPKREAEATARAELARLEQQVIASGHLPGDTYADLRSSTSSVLDPPELVLLPVWIAVVRGPKGPIRLSVNGQTGEVVGQNLPTSWVKVAALVALILFVLGGIAAAVIGFGTIAAAIGAVLQ